MNCPKCGHELSESAERCPACNADLAPAAEDEKAVPADMVTVLESTDPTLIPVVRALLEAEGIRCMVENERLQDLIGGGRIVTGYNIVVGPAYLQVAPEDEEAARALIAQHLPETQEEPSN